MEVINPNGVKVYNLSAGKTFPKVGRFFTELLSSSFPLLNEENWRRTMVTQSVYQFHAVEYRTRIELIQDFEFNQSCQKVKVSHDGNYIMTSGRFLSSSFITA